MERTRALAHDFVVQGLLRSRPRSRSKASYGGNLASGRFLALFSGKTNKEKITFIQTLIALLLVSLLINVILYVRMIGLQDELLFLAYEKYMGFGGW